MEIAIIRFDGYGQGTYTALTDREHRHRRPAVSPDGQTIAWQTNLTGPTDDIFLADIDGSNQRRLDHVRRERRPPLVLPRRPLHRVRVGPFRELGDLEDRDRDSETVQLTEDPAYVSTRPRS